MPAQGPVRELRGPRDAGASWSTDVPEAWRDELCEGLDEPVDADTALHFVMPPQLQPHRQRRNVNYTMFEADRIPPAWAAAAG